MDRKGNFQSTIIQSSAAPVAPFLGACSMNGAPPCCAVPNGVSGKLLEPCEPYIPLWPRREHFENIRAQLLERIMIVHGVIFARLTPPVDSTNRVHSQRNAGPRPTKRLIQVAATRRTGWTNGRRLPYRPIWGDGVPIVNSWRSHMSRTGWRSTERPSGSRLSQRHCRPGRT